MRVSSGRKLLFTYLLANFPSGSRFLDILDVTLPFADVVEIGIPFSDPVADGPVIQQAASQVLEHGFRVESVFKVLQRKAKTKSMALMSYANPIVAYGRTQWLKACRQCEVEFLIVPDVPAEEAADWRQEAKEMGVSWVSFVSLLTRPERLERIASSAEGFVYLLSLTGISGAEIHAEEEVRRKAIEIKKHTSVPVALGFGIKSLKDALPYLDVVDAFIIGSKITEMISTTGVRSLENFYKEFREGIEV